MEKTGTLKIANGESKVDGTLLAREVDSGQDPFGAATDFVKDNGCSDNDCVTVMGALKSKALYIDSAKKVGKDLCAPAQADALAFATAFRPVGGRPAKKKSAAKAKASLKASVPKKGATAKKAPRSTKRAVKKKSSKTAAQTRKTNASRKSARKAGKRR